MAATIQDVAKKSGVGVGTVSRVLNGGTNVRKETCDKVLEAIKELNYIPNSLGVKLRTNRNKVFALLVPVINHTFFSELAAHIEKEAEKYGCKEALFTFGFENNCLRIIRILFKITVSAIVLADFG